MVEVELSPAGKNSRSVEVLVTTAVDNVSSAKMRRRNADGLTSLSMADGGRASHEADGNDTRMHLVWVCLMRKYSAGGNTSVSVQE
jgi:hypothetical protein